MNRIFSWGKRSFRLFHFAIVLLFLLAWGGGELSFAISAQAQSSPASQPTLAVHFTELKDTKGRIVLSVYDSPEHYRKQALQVLRVPTATALQQGVSLSLPIGTYAITVYQDANANGKIDRNLIGIPTELGGFSNNPRIVMGPPSFKRCAFRLEGNLHTTILLH